MIYSSCDFLSCSFSFLTILTFCVSVFKRKQFTAIRCRDLKCHRHRFDFEVQRRKVQCNKCIAVWLSGQMRKSSAVFLLLRRTVFHLMWIGGENISLAFVHKQKCTEIRNRNGANGNGKLSLSLVKMTQSFVVSTVEKISISFLVLRKVVICN